MITGTYRQHGMVFTDHVVEVPLDHARPDGPTIEVFAREVVAADKRTRDLPCLLYLQGGPGGKAIRPATRSGFVGRALDEYRVVLLDQRGTGRSTPANRQTLPADATAQAEYLAHFRADAIVADAEAVRAEIAGGAPWDTLGQSYGGFITLTYLSQAPEGVRRAFVTGGLPSLTATAADVYRVTFDAMVEKSAAYFARHPGDRALCARIVEHLHRHDVRMPTGERLSPRRFQGVGVGLGQRSGFDTLHWLLEEAFVGGQLSDTFVAGVHDTVSLATRPLYAVFQELIYNQGGASGWAAEAEYARRPEFAVDAADFVFTGETYHPFHFAEDPALVPLAGATDLLAARTDWPALYDRERLSRNEVPVYAAVYHDDMYVPREYSLETARAVANVRPWVTNEYEHDGLRESTAVLDRLLALAKEDA
ncbi:alpha/beta fold hydrolase [Actinocatenispora rupis]|uniref:Alpha/beta hydrolase n=1 Tax=Actinocatenispora rupis TaxID=519421 RepID=A0A8J3NE03_9ACTN|nr:alpha/beta fold hydrolase [Actinocatenispora rupis]GID12044.1 alpha/beta hydrolase [Actinocatenispora rupis]